MGDRNVAPPVSRSCYLKDTGGFAADPEEGEEGDEGDEGGGPEGVGPDLETAFGGELLGEGGDGGEDFGGVGGFEELAVGELGDFAEDFESGGLAAFFPAGALDGDGGIEGGAGFGGGEDAAGFDPAGRRRTLPLFETKFPHGAGN